MRLHLGKYHGQFVYLDTEKTLNQHIIICGKSGSGKTVQLQRLITQISELSGTVLAFDFHNVFSKDQIYPLYKSVWNRLLVETDAYTHGISCPLLSPLHADNGETEDIMDLQLAFSNIFQTALKLGTRQTSTLTDAIIAASENGSFLQTGIAALDAILSEQDDDVAQLLRQRLLPITKRNLFRNGDLFIKKGKINILRLSRFDIPTQHIATEMMLSIIWRCANAGMFKGDPLYLVIDEFQNLSATPSSTLIRLLTEGRKMGVNLMLSTQLLQNCSRKYLEQHLLQAASLLIFRPPECDISALGKRIDSTNTQWQNELRSLGCGEFILIGEYEISGIHSSKPLRVSAYHETTPTNSIASSDKELHFDIKGGRRMSYVINHR